VTGLLWALLGHLNISLDAFSTIITLWKGPHVGCPVLSLRTPDLGVLSLVVPDLAGTTIGCMMSTSGF